MGKRRDLIIRRLTNEGESALEFFRGLDEAGWDRRIYAEGSRWTLRQVLCHFISIESGLLRLARDVLDGGEGAPKDLDVDEFNEREVRAMAGSAPSDLLPEFERLRADMVELVRGLDEADLEREGRHPVLGRISLEKLLKLVYRHNMMHLRDVRRVLS